MLCNFQKSCEHLDRPQHQVKHWHQAPLRLEPVGDLERNVRNACCWVCPSSSGTCATCNGPTGIPRVNGNVQCVVGSSNNFYVTTWPTPLIACWVGVPWWLHVAQCSKPNGHASLAIGSSRSFWHWLCSWLFYGRYWCASCVAGSLAWTQSNQELLGCLSAFSIWAYYLELCETNISL